jgi:hypothetical protein
MRNRRFLLGILRRDKLPVLNNKLGLIINVQLRFLLGILRQDKLPVLNNKLGVIVYVQ